MQTCLPLTRTNALTSTRERTLKQVQMEPKKKLKMPELGNGRVRLQGSQPLGSCVTGHPLRRVSVTSAVASVGGELKLQCSALRECGPVRKENSCKTWEGSWLH